MNRKELIKKYLEFFKSKNHKIIPNASLIPENDPTVLFTTAGMHPLVPYLLGQKHPLGKRLCNVQKLIRTSDIDEVGDRIHHTFFEMLGNWSLGDYFKKESIEYSFEFLIKILKISKEKISVTCFKGDKDAPKDSESEKIWKSLGINKIKFLGKEDNWWGPAGNTGPCGPDTEMFVNNVEIWNNVFMEYNKTKVKAILVDAIFCLFDENRKVNKELLDLLITYNTSLIVVTNANLEDKKNKSLTDLSKGFKNIEIFTCFNNPNKTDSKYFEMLLKEYKLKPEEVIYFDHNKENIESAKKAGINSTKLYKNNEEIKKWINKNISRYLPLKQKNVDTGMGVERTVSILNNIDDDYLTDSFLPIIKEIEHLSGKNYPKNIKKKILVSLDDGYEREVIKPMRIIADHIKAAVFILAEGITPSNTEQGYVLRRLIRRAVKYGRELNIKNFTTKIAEPVFHIYDDYSELEKNKKFILNELEKEEKKFELTLEKGMNKFLKYFKDKKLSGEEAFLLYQSYGFPIEMIKEECKKNKIRFSEEDFQKEYSKHQELSRTASVGRFKSGLADNSAQTTKLHTAAHLLIAALRIVLKDKNINQKGSNITPERLRLDFNFPRKLTEKEIKEIEDLVNKQIQLSCKVIREEMSPEEAKKKGALGIFDEKYGNRVSVYTIKDFSKEICAGPHVSNTKEIGKFKIVKEESSSFGIRRIKAIVE